MNFDSNKKRALVRRYSAASFLCWSVCMRR